MVNLFKADLFRVLRTKIVYISLIVAAGLPLFMTGVFALTDLAASSLTDPSATTVTTAYGDTLLSNTFSPVMSFSFVFAIFPVIVIMMDFGNGTIRNKVIHGYTRHQIFAAHFLMTLLYAFVITAVYVVINTICAVFILKVSPIDSSMVPIYLIYYLVGFLGVVLIAAIGCGLALSLLNAGAIILTVVGVLFFNYMGTLLELVLHLNHVSNPEYVLCFFPSYFTTYMSTMMAMQISTGVEVWMVLEAVTGIALISGGFYALGTFVFHERDFK